MFSERDEIAITKRRRPECICVLHCALYTFNMSYNLNTQSIRCWKKNSLYLRQEIYIFSFVFIYISMCVVYVCEREPQILQSPDCANQYKMHIEHLKVWSTIKFSVHPLRVLQAWVLPILLTCIHGAINILVNAT